MTRVILITGASTGFGHLTALLAHRRGWAVVATARKPGHIASPANPEEGRWLALGLDVTDPASVRAAVDTALFKCGAIDAVVNNAGIAHLGAAEEAVSAENARELDTNFLGAVRLTRAVLPPMRERGRGQIVFVSSNLGRTGVPGLAGYCASKAALEGWAESLSHEVAPFGIGVTIVEPGGYDTGFTARSLSAAPAVSDPVSPYAQLYRELKEKFFTEGGPTGEPVAEAIMNAAEGLESRLRVPVGDEAEAWAARRFREDEEGFIASLARSYGWASPGVGSREPGDEERSHP